MQTCDSQSGLCTISSSDAKEGSLKLDRAELFYVGDPMCSWCWGMSKELKQIQELCTKKSIKFSVVLGGLRIGGGDEWNEQFKSFLKNEWQNIHQRTNQKFVYTLLELKEFNYDTEPACLGVYIAKKILQSKDDNSATVLAFFSKIQEKFYAKGLNPTKLEFYHDICKEFGISIDEFENYFHSKEMREELRGDFELAGKLGARGMPSLIYVKESSIAGSSSGYATYEDILKMLGV
ncbi:MAG: DsbA family protein [Sulfurimonas sp.]|uniref:DsbA family protein n=1 Tax=Sulfurimonas sp. TaxID=2022749 RepID=UPI002606F45B|nr:DsbA family protein [Sulfurimonas sp.]MCW8895234.1 DsbA family protein [Sulfurimonas sp.]MCW8953668.1 DsbA family protein [Sulfurimonas sp.]